MSSFILGLSGTLASGKDELSSYLKKKDFLILSLSDILREEAARRNLEINTDNLVLLGNELRKKFGNGVLAEEVIKMINPEENYCIISIKNPAEAEILRRIPNFKLIFLDAPLEQRFNRLILRDSENTATTIEEFKKAESQQLESSDSSSQQLIECKKISDFILFNDGSIDEFYKNIDDMLSMISQTQ